MSDANDVSNANEEPVAVASSSPTLPSLPTLNAKQQLAVSQTMNGDNILLTGPAGTGKSFTIKYIIELLKANNKNVGLTATTGTAAFIIGGQTIHSYMGMGIGEESIADIFIKIKKKASIYRTLVELDVLIIDEVSMLDAALLEKISGILCYVKSHSLKDTGLLNKPFGGIQIIFIGDFCQLAPVKGFYCFLSKLWIDANIKVIMLDELVRQNDDLLFQQILQIIRKGKCTDNILKVLNALKDTQFEDEIIPTKLYPKNVNVDKINEIEIDKLKKAGNKTIIYKAIAGGGCGAFAGINKYDVELVENSQVIITRNIDIVNGLVNGTRGIVKNLFKDFVIIKDTQGNLHNIVYYKDILEGDGGKKSAKAADKSHILHMPLKVSYALSIHKSQGMTIDAMEIDLGDNIFTCGQGYTALSRAKSLRSIRVIDVSNQSFKINPFVKAFYNNILK
uniref:AAA+ ATPase domain-containing protein n=1 Tax=viral metagenome TaxID=1070528 RepID=A0A6C0K7S5_9ZZZZ